MTGENNPAPQWFNDLLAPHKAPCVSIYMPAPRVVPPGNESPVRFANLVRKAEESLRERYSTRQIGATTSRLQELSTIHARWDGDHEGLAFFVSQDFQRSIALQNPVDELVEVADQFHIKPLLQILQADDRYQILCLEMKRVTMWEGSRMKVLPLDNPNIPQSPVEVAGMTLADQSTARVDKIEGSKQAGESGAPAEEANPDHFFAAVDRAVWENYSRLSHLPLLLCAAGEHQNRFRWLSKNQYLDSEGIDLDPHALSPERLREEAWRIIGPRVEKKIGEMVDQFRVAKAHEHGSDELMQVAQAAAQGRVGSLLLREDYQVQGFVDPASGAVRTAESNNPHAGDVLDELAALVLRADGNVLVLPPANMPTDTGVAAIYRY